MVLVAALADDQRNAAMLRGLPRQELDAHAQRLLEADSDDELVDLIRSMAAFSGHAARRFDIGYPLLDLRLPGGHRLAAMMGVPTRPALSIRRPRHGRVFLDDLVRLAFQDVRSTLADQRSTTAHQQMVCW